MKGALHQFMKVHRWFNPTKRATTSFSEALDHHFLSNWTLQKLYEREVRGDSPRLLINGTLYNNGRRFVITTLPQEEFAYNFPQKRGVASSPTTDDGSDQAQWLEEPKKAEEHLVPLTFASDEIKADSRGVPLSKAVAASASFPP